MKILSSDWFYNFKDLFKTRYLVYRETLNCVFFLFLRNNNLKKKKILCVCVSQNPSFV